MPLNLFTLCWTLALFLGCAAGLTVQGAEPLRIGVEANDAPLSFVDEKGKPDGFSAALIGAMQKEGLGEVKLVANWWTPLLAQFRAGNLDVLTNVSVMEETQRDMEFSISHVYLHGVLYTVKGRPEIVGASQFSGKKIGAVYGSVAFSTATANAGWGGKLVEFDSLKAAVDGLRSGACDGLLQVYAFDRKFALLRAPDLHREVMWDIIHHLSFAVHKGDAATLAKLNDALANVIRAGELERIYQRWIGSAENRPIRLVDLRPYAVAIIAGSLLIAGIILWQRRMLSRLAEQAKSREETEHLFASVIDSALAGWVIHRDGTIVMANPAAANLVGLKVENLIDHNLLEFIAPEFRAITAASVAERSERPIEMLALRADGSTVPIEVAGRSCVFRAQPARIVSIRDLAAQKQAAADQLAISKLESTAILAGGIAHDFNNFLATISLNVDLLRSMPGMPEASLDRLQIAKHTTQSAKALIGQLVTFSRGDASHPVATNLTNLLSRSITIPLAGSNVRADIDIADDLWVATVDPAQIERVTHNLVLNAREAMPTGGVIRITAHNVTVQNGEMPGLTPGPYVLIEIADQGTGIPDDVLSKIFDPYFSTKQRGMKKGMGLGLTICLRIIKQHGGSLAVRTKPGTGSTFIIHLPATPGAASPAPPTLPLIGAGGNTPPVAVRRRILVMDDEEMLLETLAMTLQRFGYDVETAQDGMTALAKCIRAQDQRQPFQAVVLDLTVRGSMGGLEAMQGLRKIDPTLRAVLISGHAEQSVLREHTRFGFDAALTKPFDFEELRDVLAKLLRD